MSIDRIASNPVSRIPSTYKETDQQQAQPNVKNSEEQQKNQEQQERKVPKDYLEKTVNGVNEFLLPSTTSLHFQMHEKLEEYYVQVVDDQTHEVIREIPSKEFLDMYAAMRDLLGLVVDEKV